MGRLFGTDGARGVAITELTCELAMQIGRAAAMVLTKETNHKAKIIIGKDTRISGDFLESALAAGMAAGGCDIMLLGVIPLGGQENQLGTGKALRCFRRIQNSQARVFGKGIFPEDVPKCKANTAQRGGQYESQIGRKSARVQ